MVEKGNVLSVTNGDGFKTYLVDSRLENIGKGAGGWLCVDMDAIDEKGIDNIDAFDCWRVTDRYIEFLMSKGLIKIVEENYEN
jgi:hypothetical protein